MTESTQRKGWRKVGIVGLWTVTVLEAFFMGVAGAAKFGTAAGWWAERFVEWGYPDGFSYVTGGAEVLLAIVLLLPRAAAYASAGLILVMLGALATVLLNPDGRLGPVPPAMHIGILVIILWARWGVRWRRAPA